MSRRFLFVPSLQSFVAGRRRRSAVLALVGALSMSFAGCSAVQSGGHANSYVVLRALSGANGATPSELGGNFASDVVTYVKTTVGGQEVLVPTMYEDPGEAIFSLGMKDPSLTPTTTNFITLNRYRVTYVRADGRNTPGVDVPYPFDGAITLTVGDKEVKTSLTLVRIQAKQEAPLKQLAGGGGAKAISTLADVTFFGSDQAGREVTVTGRIGVTFADWGDPD